MIQEAKDEVIQLYLDDIIPNRFQPREVFDERALKELAVSIKEHGVIQPIIVRNVQEGKYEIIAGERRYKASALAGLTKIPAIIRNLDDKESSKVALLENLQRKNLNAIEEARTYQKILEIDENLTQEELAKTMGKTQSAVSNKIRLLALPSEVQDALLKEEISERHARALLNIKEPEKQIELLKKIMESKMSVRALEEEIQTTYGNKETTQEASVNAFVNSQPLMPTAEIPKDESNYGKVVIAPPEGEESPINQYLSFTPENSSPLDQKEETEQTPSIEQPEETTVQEETSTLENLLSFGNPNSSTPSTSFMTPAEKIVKSDIEESPTDVNSEYFNTPEISSITLPNIVQDTAEQPKIEEDITIEKSIEKIRDTVKDLEEKGIKIKIDEMNFEKSYQIIIKIDKQEE